MLQLWISYPQHVDRGSLSVHLEGLGDSLGPGPIMSCSETNLYTCGRHFRRPDVGMANCVYGDALTNPTSRCAHIWSERHKNRVDAKMV